MITSGRARPGASGAVAPGRFAATLRGVTRRYVAEPNLSRVDKALLPADEYLWLTRSGLYHRSPLQNSRHPHLLAVYQRRKIRENNRLVLGGHPVKWDQALRLLLRHDTNGITS